MRAAGGIVAGAAAQPRRLAILALLASAGDSGLTRDKLIAYLWPDVEEERARRGLNQAVYALRQDLGGEDILLGGRDLRLNPELVTSDVGEFSAAVRQGRLEAAAGHYAGTFLDGFHLTGAPEFERWAEEERASLAHDYAATLEKLARRSAERGEPADAVGWWRKLAAQDPLNARIAVGLMRALVAVNDRAGALQHARVYEVLMEQELDAPPDREVVVLAAELRRSLEANGTGVPAVTGATLPEPAPAQSPAEPTTAATQPEPSPAAAQSDPTPLAVRPEPVAAPVHPAPPPATAAAAPRSSRRSPVGLAAAASLLAAGFAAGLLFRSRDHELVPGAAVRVATDERLELDPSVSSDGRTLAYAADVGGRFQIFVRRWDGGAAVPVSAALPGSHRRPVWSPDGGRLAFQSAGSIYVVDALGGTPRLLVQPRPGSWAAYPTWSPDGRSLAYVERWAVYVRPVEGGAARLVTDRMPAHSLSWSPDGRWIAFVSGNPMFQYGELPWGSAASIGNAAPSSVWVVPAAGGAPVPVTDAAALNTSPTWLPRGRGLLFVSDRDGARDVYQVALGRDGRPRAPARRVTTGLGVHSIGLSADAGELVYSVFTNVANVWTVPIPSRGVAPLADAKPLTEGTQAVEGIVVAPDGRSLVFDSDREGNQDVYRLSLADGSIQRLTWSPEKEFVTGWSADGRELAYHAYHGGNRQVRVMAAEGGPPHAVAAGAPRDQRSPGFAPDGRSLVFTAAADGGRRLFVVERTGGSDTTWGAPRQLTREESWYGRWSPDGGTIAYCRPDGLWLVAPDGRNPRRLLATAGDTASPSPETVLWAPDGRTLYYKAFDDAGRSSFWAVPAAGGVPRLLLRFDDPARPSSRAEFATDGRRLFFTVGTRQSDVWAMALRER